jgi:hypothetical protein
MFTCAELSPLMVFAFSSVMFLSQSYSVFENRHLSAQLRRLEAGDFATTQEALTSFVIAAACFLLWRNMKRKRWAAYGVAAVDVLLLIFAGLAVLVALFPSTYTEQHARGEILLFIAPAMILLGAFGLYGICHHLKMLALEENRTN